MLPSKMDTYPLSNPAPEIPKKPGLYVLTPTKPGTPLTLYVGSTNNLHTRFDYWRHTHHGKYRMLFPMLERDEVLFKVLALKDRREAYLDEQVLIRELAARGADVLNLVQYATVGKQATKFSPGFAGAVHSAHGVEATLAEHAAAHGLATNTLRKRLYRGATLEQALTAPAPVYQRRGLVSLADRARANGVPPSRAYRRIAAGWDPDIAVSLPLGSLRGG